MTNTVQIWGDGKVIQIEVFGYERPDAADADDANWLKARCSVTVAEFSATLSLSPVAHDFARFACELEEAVQLLKGTAAFSTAEAGLGIEIKFTTAGHADVSEAYGHKRHLYRTSRYSRSRLKLTNRFSPKPCVNLKQSCPDSPSATVSS